MGMGVKWGWRVGLGLLAATTVALIPAGMAFATTSPKTSSSSSTSTSSTSTSSSTGTSTSTITTAPTTTTTTYGGSPTTFSFSGALHGTLHITPRNNCAGAGNGGATLDEVSGSLGGSKGKTWSIIIYAPRDGTWKYVKHPKHGLETFSFVIETPGKKTVFSWADTGGSMTTNGGKGTANLTLSGRTGGAKGTVHVKGSWNCPVET
jgi:hypothetical protein